MSDTRLLQQILQQNKQILKNEELIMSTLDDVVAAVADEDTTIDGAVVAINGLQAQIAALKTTQTDPATQAKIDGLVADITAKKAALAAAIVVGTPSPGPVTPSTPVVTPAAAMEAAKVSVTANPVSK